MGNASIKANAEMAAAQSEATAATDRLAAAQERLAVASADLAKIQTSDILRGSQVQVAAEAEVTAAMQEVTVAENEAAVAAERLTAAQAGAAAGAGAMRERLGRVNTIVRSTGHSMLLFGGVAVAGFALAAHAAAQYNTQITLAATQIGNNSKQVARDSRRLAQEGIKQLQMFGGSSSEIAASFYDIFSTLPVKMKQGIELLTQFQQVAIAGQVGLRDATQGVITVMNSFGLKTIPQVRSGINTMFATVRFGRTTFAEFNSALATIAPASRQWNQNITSMGGAVAFLTTRLGNVPKAATAYARSLDVLGNQKFVDAMKKQGVTITDNKGRLLDLHTVIGRILQQFPKLAHGQGIQNFLKAQIGTTSTIQARRGLTLLFGQYPQYGKILKEVTRDNTEFYKSFKALRGSDAVKLQIFVGNLKALVLLIGEQAIPIFVELTKPLQAVFMWFNSLSKGTQNLIIKILAWVAVATVIIGILLTIAATIGGMALLISGLGIGFGTLALIIGAVIIVFAALIAIGYLVYKNWDMIKKYALIAWKAISSAVTAAYDTIVSAIKSAWHWIMNTDFVTTLISAWDQVSSGVRAHVDDIKGTLRQLGRAATAVFNAIAHNPFMRFLERTVSIGFNLIKGLFRAGWGAVKRVTQGDWRAIQVVVRAAWDAIKRTVHNEMQIVGDIIVLVMDIIQGKWGAAWHRAISLVKHIFGTLRGIVTDALIRIPGAILQACIEVGMSIIAGIVVGVGNGVGSLADAVKSAASSALQTAKSFLQISSPSKKAAKDIGKPIIQGVILGMINEAQGGKTKADIRGAMNTIASAMMDEWTNIQSTMQSNFGDLFQGAVIQEKIDWGEKLSIKDLTKDLRSQKHQFDIFRKDLNKIAGKGAPLGLIKQLEQLGPSANSELEAMAHATKKQLKQYYRLWTQSQGSINKATKDGFDNQRAIWTSHGRSMAVGILLGLKSEQPALERYFKHLAQVLVAGFRKHNKSHSPSLLYAQEGKNIMMGLEMGMRRYPVKVPLPVMPGHRHGAGVAGVVNNYNTTYNIHQARDESLMSTLRKHDFVTRKKR